MGEGPPVAALSGLSEEEAGARLAAEGPNELPRPSRHGVLALAGEVVREPMILLLLAAGGLYLVIGDTRDALVLGVSVAGVVGISLYQNRKTERALEALRELSSPRALVLRGAEPRRIPGREVVRGDLIVLAEGDRVPADATLVQGDGVEVDESLLTGESVPVRKRAGFSSPASELRPGGNDLPRVFSGTLVVRGSGIAQVEATGPRTEIGRIGGALKDIEPGKTPLERQIRRIVRTVAIAAAALCAVLVVFYGLSRGDWLRGVLSGVTLAMSLLPEEFPVVMTVFLALGAWRLARNRVLTRRSAAIETLGAATVLCVDKTGTLTQNRMSLRALAVDARSWEVEPQAAAPPPEPFRELLRTAAYASDPMPFDPTDQAIRAFADGAAPPGPPGRLLRQYPLKHPLLAVCGVWEVPGSSGLLVAAKGAAESIAELCRLDAAATAALARRADSMAAAGMRVLAVARASWSGRDLPEDPRAFPFEPQGLVGLADPLRPGVPDAVASCRASGIRVVMITGDSPVTARNIADQAGLPDGGELVTGGELDALDDASLARRCRAVSVFARVMPEQKLRIVRALRADEEVVGMTGDGVNDAPALRASHIGIAMGGRGTDVAREAADLILLDDDFSSIVGAVALGRRIYDNLQKAIAYLLSVHVPIAGMALLPVVLGWSPVLLPAHIVFLELIIDPACSMAFEAEPAEADAMRRPPRKAGVPLVAGRSALAALARGAGVLAVTFAVFLAAVLTGRSDSDARALSFVTLVVGNLALIVANRSWSRGLVESFRVKNRALVWVLGGTTAILALALAIPALRGVFGFSVLHWDDFGICLAGGFSSVVGLEVMQKTLRARSGRPPA